MKYLLQFLRNFRELRVQSTLAQPGLRLYFQERQGPHGVLFQRGAQCFLYQSGEKSQLQVVILDSGDFEQQSLQLYSSILSKLSN